MRPDITPGGMILTLARGHYCPKEHHQHLELAQHYPKFAVGYTRLATISTDEHDTSQGFRPDWDLSTPGLRERWDAGDLAPFHGWDRRVAA